MGRSGDRHAGRSSRGRFNRTSQHRQQKPKKKKKTIDDYCFYVGSSKHASDFETISRSRTLHIKRFLLA